MFLILITIAIVASSATLETYAMVKFVDPIDQEDYDKMIPIINDSTLVEVQVASATVETHYGTLTTYIWK